MSHRVPSDPIASVVSRHVPSQDWPLVPYVGEYHGVHLPVISSPSTRRPATTGSVSALLALLSVLLLVLVAVRWAPLVALDGRIARTTHRWALDEPGLTHVFRILTDWVWDPVTMRLLAAAAVLRLVFRRSARWAAGWLVVWLVVEALAQNGLKAAVGRPRPVWAHPVDTAGHAAFPSGHAMTAALVCGLLLWILRKYGVGRVLWRWAVAVAALSVLGVGFTRVWLGVHWASDVVGGWLIGATTVAAAIASYERRPGDRPSRDGTNDTN